MHHIVFLDRAIAPFQLRKPQFPHTWAEFPTTREEQLNQRLKDATIVISSKIALPAAALEHFPGVHLIAVAGTGYDVFDIEYCRARGIAVCNVRDYARHSVPEHTIALMLALRRNFFAYRADVEAGLWQR
ncbi:MAG: glycerate dehydrogenase, partial [Burkholderiales bacterium]